ncbi:prepilin peptidase [Candidatus Saccharibacteria bacterium]|nr:prepilin peptidase [Candidatus Saccharibacteria bacterium]
MLVCFFVFLFIIGACLGSFLCCQARRLHLKETASKKSRSALGRRSVCLSCKYQLKWYDNLPIVSWLCLRGKCRKCGQKIGATEILAEIGVGLAFLIMGTTIDLLTATPLAWATFLMLILFTLVLSFLAIYDGLYGELPSLCLTIAIICATIILILKEWTILSVSPFTSTLILDPLAAVLILGGLYLVLYLVSKGKWVGDGDWLLGLALGLALGHPWLALATLFLSNFLACLTIIPLAKGHHSRRIYFGPFLVIAFVIVYGLSGWLLTLLSVV